MFTFDTFHIEKSLGLSMKFNEYSIIDVMAQKYI